ncbi:MAG: DNA repair protein RecO [Candidatus Syntrophosphaera sp.]|nr:DNA repair protein RecO [Candidatus Syntrophosphaera sp.]
MKARIKDSGIIFKTSPYSESSLILKAFLRERGLISIIAKGIRKKAEADLLNPLCDYEFTLYEPQEGGLYLLCEFSLARQYDLSRKVESWTAAECAIELYSRLIIPSDENPQYHELLHQFLDYLLSVDKNAILIWWRFLLRVFTLLGTPFRPDHCAVCHDSGRKIIAYDKGAAILICPDCFEPSSEQVRYELLSSQGSTILQLLPRIGDHVSTIGLEGECVRQINRIFADFYLSHYNRPLKLRSLEVLEQFYR